MPMEVGLKPTCAMFLTSTGALPPDLSLIIKARHSGEVCVIMKCASAESLIRTTSSPSLLATVNPLLALRFARVFTTTLTLPAKPLVCKHPFTRSRSSMKMVRLLL